MRGMGKLILGASLSLLVACGTTPAKNSGTSDGGAAGAEAAGGAPNGQAGSSNGESGASEGGAPTYGECGDFDGDGRTGMCGDVTDCDDNDESVWDEVTAYVDEDGDGFGTGDGEVLCIGDELPEGYAESAGDCDEEDDEIFPEQVETCGDEVDSDCNEATECEGVCGLDEFEFG
jgi:hypothetical protein